MQLSFGRFSPSEMRSVELKRTNPFSAARAPPLTPTLLGELRTLPQGISPPHSFPPRRLDLGVFAASKSVPNFSHRFTGHLNLELLEVTPDPQKVVIVGPKRFTCCQPTN